MSLFQKKALSAAGEQAAMTDHSTPEIIPQYVFRIWNHRHRIEIEAAHLFHHLGEEMGKVWGLQDPIVQLCFQSANDELRHAERCQQILDLSSKPIKKEIPDTHLVLGPQHHEIHDRVLYACVAMGCVTETLSTALLLRMRQCAQHSLIKEIIHEILEDEINHSRIGWAEIARYSQTKDPSWLSPSIEKMIQAALQTDIEPMINPQNQIDLSPWGILTAKESREITSETIKSVIIPGLRNYIPLNLETNLGI